MKKHLLGGLGAVMFVQSAGANPPEGTYQISGTDEARDVELSLDRLRDIESIASHMLSSLGDEVTPQKIRDARAAFETGLEDDKVVFIEMHDFPEENTWEILRYQQVSIPADQRTEWIVINQVNDPAYAGIHESATLTPGELVGAYADSRAQDGNDEDFTHQHFQLIERVNGLLLGDTLPEFISYEYRYYDGRGDSVREMSRTQLSEARVAYGGSQEDMLHYMYEHSYFQRSIPEQVFREAMKTNPEVLERLQSDGLRYIERELEVIEVLEANSERLRELSAASTREQSEVYALRSKRKKAEAQQEADEAREELETFREDVLDDVRETRFPGSGPR